jgi:ubiquinone/menaquinone biosynthesis C-methylase UbiE
VNKWSQKRKVIRGYDAMVLSYDALYGEEQLAKYGRVLENYVIISGNVILDVGCGTGLLFNRVASDAETVVGVDASGGLLLVARERAKEFGNVYLVRADADHLPFRYRCFSLIFAFTVLQNMPKPMDTLESISKTAMDAAVIVVTGLKKYFTEEAFMNLLRQAGLRLVSIVSDDSLKCYVVVVRRSV